MNFHKTRVATAVFAALVSASAFADVKIAVIGPVTGGSSSMGVSIAGGAALAAAEINSAGGVLGGQKIVLVKYDDKSKADIGEEAAKNAVESEKVVAAIGFGNTGVAAKAVPVFQKGGVPLLITATTGTTLTQMTKKEPVNFIFRNVIPDSLQTEAVVKEMVEVNKFKRIAVFADSSAYGNQGIEQVLAHLKKRGVEPVMIERFPINKTNFEEAAIKVGQLKVDGIITWCLGTEAAGIRVSLNRVGLRTPLAGSWALTWRQYADAAGPIANGTLAPASFTSDTTRPAGQKMIRNYRTLHNTVAIPSGISAAQSYDAIYLLARAINQAKSTEGKKVVEALEDLNGTYEGAVMDYTKPFSKERRETFADVNQVQLGKNKDGESFRASAK